MNATVILDTVPVEHVCMKCGSGKSSIGQVLGVEGLEGLPDGRYLIISDVTEIDLDNVMVDPPAA